MTIPFCAKGVYARKNAQAKERNVKPLFSIYIIPYRARHCNIYKKTRKSVPELEILNLGLSMCDCYWFQPVGKEYNWDDINFYDNGYGTEIGRMLINATSNTPESLKTPDATLPGECPKMWARFNNTNYLVKGCRTYNGRKIEICNE